VTWRKRRHRREPRGDGVGAPDVPARGARPAVRHARGGLPERVGRGRGPGFRGTVSYALGESWNVIDALYFAVATLTTTSVSDPDLVLDAGWMKLFTVFYLLIGIGILVEILRRLGIAFVAIRAQDQAAKAARKDGSAATRGPDGAASE
jgi:Ion channel